MESKAHTHVGEISCLSGPLPNLLWAVRHDAQHLQLASRQADFCLLVLFYLPIIFDYFFDYFFAPIFPIKVIPCPHPRIAIFSYLSNQYLPRTPESP